MLEPWGRVREGGGAVVSGLVLAVLAFVFQSLALYALAAAVVGVTLLRRPRRRRDVG